MNGTHRSARGMAATLAGLLALAAGGAADTYYVATNGVDSRTGKGDWTNALATISNALAKATGAGDIILVSNGVHVLNATLSITNPVSVVGHYGHAETVIDGNAPTRTYRGAQLNHAQALVSGFTFSNCQATSGGSAYEAGGAIRIDSGTVSNCVIRNCTANRNGGGAAVYGADSLLIDCTLYDNASTGSAYYGGGMDVNAGRVAGCVVSNCTAVPGGGAAYVKGDSILERCLIVSNRSSAGGGIHNINSATYLDCTVSSNYASYQAGGFFLAGGYSAVLSNCLIEGNSARRYSAASSGYGGGLYELGGTRIVGCVIRGNTGGNAGGGARTGPGSVWERCVFQNNLAENTGGGLDISAGAAGMTVRDCLFAGNSAQTNGGGLYSFKCAWELWDCTIVANSAGGSGGGLYNDHVWTVTYTNTTVNTILYFNTAGSYSNYYVVDSKTNYIAYSNCCLAPSPGASYGTGNISTDPGFVNAAGGDYHLIQDSPCVNKGLYAPTMDAALDVEGRLRLDRFTRQVDIGAYEFVWPGSMFSIR